MPLGKLIDAIQLGNLEIANAVAPLLTERHPSQIYQALMEGLALFLILVWVWRKPQKPGVVGFTFGLGYGLFRIIGEYWRLPDAGIGFEALGLTRGQWLSVPLVVVGLVGLAIVLRRDAAPVGGWRGKPQESRSAEGQSNGGGTA